MRYIPKLVLSRKARRSALHFVKWGLIFVALVLFFADIIAAAWPEFSEKWGNVGRAGIGLATLAAFTVEIIHDELEEGDKLKRALASSERKAAEEGVELVEARRLRRTRRPARKAVAK